MIISIQGITPPGCKSLLSLSTPCTCPCMPYPGCVRYMYLIDLDKQDLDLISCLIYDLQLVYSDATGITLRESVSPFAGKSTISLLPRLSAALHIASLPNRMTSCCRPAISSGALKKFGFPLSIDRRITPQAHISTAVVCSEHLNST